jgi:hypothetical protein
MGDDLTTQIIARVITIAFGLGIAWALAWVTSFFAPSWETTVFAGFGSVWTVIGLRGILGEIRFQRSRSRSLSDG